MLFCIKKHLHKLQFTSVISYFPSILVYCAVERSGPVAPTGGEKAEVGEESPNQLAALNLSHNGEQGKGRGERGR